MSRLGKKPITIPKGTTVSFNDGVLSVKGPLGELTRVFDDKVIGITITDSTVILAPKVETLNSALWGTYASHIINMIDGVNKAYEKRLIVEGVGFTANVRGSDLVLELGFSHDIKVTIPAGLKVTSEKNEIVISGMDKEVVGQFTAKVRSLKKPEPYKGKGIHYVGEIIRRKQGKKAA